MRLKQPKHPLIYEHICTMEYYSAVKKKILSHARTCMNLEDIMLNEISQLQRDKYRMYLSRVVKFTETESIMWLPGAGEGVESCCSMGIEFQFHKVKNS